MQAIPDYDYCKYNKSNKFTLENGAEVITEYSMYYGDFITNITMPDGMTWNCSDGIEGLPEFARPWIEKVNNGLDSLVRPQFTVNWKGE